LTAAVANAAFPLSALITAPLLARGLGPTGRGELAALLTPLSIAEAVSAVGTPLAAAYFVRSGSSVHSVRRTGCLIVAVSGTATALALVFTGQLLLNRYPDLIPVFRWLSLSIAVNVFIELYRGVRSGQEAYGRVNANYWLSALSRLVMIVLLAISDALTPTRVAVLSIVLGLISGLTLWRRPGRAPGPAPERRPAVSIGRMLRFALHSWAGVVSASIGARLDQLLLIGLVSPRVLGIYVVAATAAQVPMALFSALQRLTLNRAASSADPAALVHAGRFSASLAVLITVVVAPLLPWLVPLVFGRPFASAVPLAELLLVGAALWGIGQSLSGLLIGLGAPGRASLADTIGTVSLCLALVPLQALWGVSGAAVAVVISAAVTTTLKASFLTAGRGLTVASLLRPSPRALWQGLEPGPAAEDRRG
jgi:O-antigen/teichoic acid export membrane protein